MAQNVYYIDKELFIYIYKELTNSRIGIINKF